MLRSLLALLFGIAIFAAALCAHAIEASAAGPDRSPVGTARP